jgi:hypothetical protein
VVEKNGACTIGCPFDPQQGCEFSNRVGRMRYVLDHVQAQDCMIVASISNEGEFPRRPFEASFEQKFRKTHLRTEGS